MTAGNALNFFDGVSLVWYDSCRTLFGMDGFRLKHETEPEILLYHPGP